MGQAGIFLRIYLHPVTAFGRVIDEGRMAFAVAVAALAIFAVQTPRTAEIERMAAAGRQYAKEHPAPPPPARAATSTAATPAPASVEEDEDAAESPAPPSATMPVRYAAEAFVGFTLFRYFAPVVALAICFVPGALLVLTLWEGLGSFANVLFRNYLPLLLCGLMAFGAAYLPLALVNAGLLWFRPSWHPVVVTLPWTPPLWYAASGCFAVLFLCALRTLMGTSLLHAAGAAGGGWVAGVLGIWIHSLTGNVTWYLASPCVLYYLWSNLQPSFSSIGYGLRSRQSMKRNLETLTVNPRDADAHCQLGVIYAQRRQNDLASERFKKAIEIDASEPEPWYQLGLIAHQQGRYADALADCRTAARLDDKHSGSEVWREIGALEFLSGNLEAAQHALEKYIGRREYDPEGQCWYGRVMAAQGESEAARQAFQTAIEAARTMPAPRKHQVRMWGSEAGKELRALTAALR